MDSATGPAGGNSHHQKYVKRPLKIFGPRPSPLIVEKYTNNVKKQRLMEPSHLEDDNMSHAMNSSLGNIFRDFRPSLSKELQPPLLKLRFLRSPPPILFTRSRIVAEDGSPIVIELVDTSTDARVTMGSPSFSWLEIVALDADFAEENWTTETFNQNILRSREGKLPLLVGDPTVTLKDGVGEIGDITFTDNSKSLRSKKFRLGAKAIQGGIMEAISEAFVCKDHPGGSKNSVAEFCLRQAGIHTAKDLRRHLSINSMALPRVRFLTSDITIIEHRSQRSLIFDINWRKYGQKAVQVGTFPRSYSMCTNPGCSATKKVERSLDGHVTEIILGGHNQKCPQNTKRGNRDSTENISGISIHNSFASYNSKALQFQTSSFYKTKREQQNAAGLGTKTEHISEASDIEEVNNGDEDEPDPKRRRAQIQKFWEPEAVPSDKSITESRVTFQTTSELDVLDDGYRWRKYGHKFIDGNSFPRRYYRCSTHKCRVRKHVERPATDPKSLVTTYKGKHNHDLLAVKSSSRDESSGDVADGSLELEKLQHDFNHLRGHSSYLTVQPGVPPLTPSTAIVLPSLPKTLQPSLLKLRFINSLPPMIVRNSRIKAEDGSPITIELVDIATNTRVTSDSLSFARLEIVPLNADISEESLTTEEFNRNILCSREGKPPLLVGDSTVTLKDGIGVLSGYLFFTDDLSWLRSGKFRLGAKVTEGGAREAISKAFVCIENPERSYRKFSGSIGFEPLSTCVTRCASKDYDVVIRYGKGDIGNDVFISHLRAALCRRGISVYEVFDEVDAVPECSVLIILLTSTYVPLNLLNILEHQQAENGAVYPIFYRLSPYDLISNIRFYRQRFFLQDEPKRWQTALKEITQMPGYTLTDKSESKLIDEIVRDALKVLCSGYKMNIIGIDTQVEEILSLLRIEALDVRSIGIWGTVGIGKTSIAEEIFRRVSVQYETCLFLKDLHKEIEDKGQDAVREEFLSKVLDVAPHIIRISDIKASFLRSRLQHKRVLIVLDDVNDYRDVETILGKLNYFGPGSRIIITSRNRRVFVLCKTDHVYEVKPLDIPSSLLLLDRGTFQIGLSPEVYRKMSLELVKFSNGNPQVLQFLGKSDREWNSLSQEIQKTSPMHIPNIFKRSCCGLDDNERSIFLDIACFFRRMEKDNVAMLLDGSGFSTHVGFRSLVDKSLLTISHNMVDMLTYIQATGREIVRQESADSPGNRSRLWNTEDIRDVFMNDSGTSAIEGIFLEMSKLKLDANPNIFEKMWNLRLLKFYCSKVMANYIVTLPQGLKYLPSKLRLLHWEYYPLKSLPQSFDPRNLVELNLPNSSAEKLWKGKKSLEKLKKMRLSHSCQLTKIPSLSRASNLEYIDLEGCNSLLSISQSISYLKKLVFLNLKDCSQLESIPSMVYLECLEVLNLSGCSKLENFPEISPNVKELYMGGTLVQEIPSSIKNLVLLEKLDLENSRHLKSLPTSICKLKHLETLNLSGCTSLDHFPDLSRRMKCLRFIDLSRTAIKELPSSISYLTALEEMRFENSRMSKGYLVPNKVVAVGGGIEELRPAEFKPPLATKQPLFDLKRESLDFLPHFTPKNESVKSPSSSSSFNKGCDEEEAGVEKVKEFLHSAFTGGIKWQKGQRLGRGSFGSLYEGISVDGDFFAVEEVSLFDQGSLGQECIQQLEEEIALLSQLQHQNIVRYYGTTKDQRNLYIFLELVTQGSLVKFYQTSHLGESVVSVYTRQILDGLKYLHDNGFIHRDVQCSTIFVDASGGIKLANFGLGKVSKFNGIKSYKGTPNWTAPEVINCKRDDYYGSPADIWSLGCTVLEMLTRQIPYSHMEPVQVLFSVGKGKLPEIPDTLTQEARHFIHSCLKVQPEERPTADELLNHPFVTRSLPSSGSGSGSASLPHIYNVKDWE